MDQLDRAPQGAPPTYHNDVRAAAALAFLHSHSTAVSAYCTHRVHTPLCTKGFDETSVKTMQYWKPGETKPRGGERSGGPLGDRGGSGSGGRANNEQGRTDGKKKKRVDKSRRDEGDRGSTDKGKRRSSEGAKKSVRKGKGKERHSTGSGLGGIRGEVSRAASKPPVAGPSQGLLAMKVSSRGCNV